MYIQRKPAVFVVLTTLIVGTKNGKIHRELNNLIEIDILRIKGLK